MREVIFGVTVWGDTYIETFLELSLPSFLAANNIPACRSLANLQFVIVTRPENQAIIQESPVVEHLREFAEVEVVPLLTSDKFDGNRYSTMVEGHQYIIARAIDAGAILSILSPDCIIADGGIAHCLEQVIDGMQAVQVCGPRALLDEVGPILAKPPYSKSNGCVLDVPARDLVSFLTKFPHPMSKLLYWDANPFSAFPSALYWSAGEDSILARYFHLHPLFIDMSAVSTDVSESGTADGLLLQLTKIPQERVCVITSSQDTCVVEVSRLAHEPMGSVPENVDDKVSFVSEWAQKHADATHVKQFNDYVFRFEGLVPVDWASKSEIFDSKLSELLKALRRIETRHVAGVPTHDATLGGDDLLLQQNQPQARVQVSNRTFQRLTRFFLPEIATWLAKQIWPILVALSDLILAVRHVGATWKGRDWEPPSNLPDVLQTEYETDVVPLRAQRPSFLLRLFHRICKVFEIVFVVNVIPGMGHNTVELDYFMRLQESGRIPKRRYILVRQHSPIHDETCRMYGKNFWATSCSSFLANWTAPATARFADIRLSCGLSRLRWQLRDDLSYSRPPKGQTFLHQISKAENRKEWMRYFHLRSETRHLAPLRNDLELSQDLVEFLDGETNKLALIHLKQEVVNAAAGATDPDTYVDAIKWLQGEGYTVVMIGREAMPVAFQQIGVVNYARSPIASYRHDLELTAAAQIVVTGGSGIAMMADCMGVPLVYLNSWHVGMPLASERCIIVPTLVRDKNTSELLSLSEQNELYLSLEDRGDEIFPFERYSAQDASAGDILAAVKECLSLEPNAKLDRLQSAYIETVLGDQSSVVGSRVSASFAAKHGKLIEGIDSEVPR